MPTGPRRASRGFTLIEVVIGVAVLGLILASIPPVLLMITHAQFEWREQRVAESLTRNQVEYLKVSPYKPGNETNPLPEYQTVLTPNESYAIDIVAQPIHPETKVPLNEGDMGLQEITITVEHADERVLETKTYKVDRLSL